MPVIGIVRCELQVGPATDCAPHFTPQPATSFPTHFFQPRDTRMIASASRCLITATLILFASGARADVASPNVPSPTNSSRIQLAQAGNPPQAAELPTGRPQAAATLS